MSFSEIGGLTDKRATTLTYTDEEADLILANIRGNVKLLNTRKPENTLRQIEYLLKKEINLNLHAVTLGEYYRVTRIPRGLRILLRPTLCSESKEFVVKWQNILNKCSLDLILLTIVELQKNLDTVAKEIKEIELLRRLRK